ncbi:hypothetical protein H6F89_01635 [Cyanobacteria bacterium FACHB-63]|nr:hypothetical protein [Cyanobacteria bacterium FACHB-63]
MLSRYDDAEGKFSPEQIEDKIEDFEEKVSGKLTNAPTGRFLIAAGIFGALVIPCGLPAAGAISLPFLVNAAKKAIRNGHQAEYVAKTGIFCHLLNHSEIAQLIRFTGRNFIIDQCVQAHIDGMKLTGAAIELVEMIEGELTPTSFAEVKKAFAPEPQKELATVSAVGNSTKLGAIDVPAQTVGSSGTVEPETGTMPVISPVDYLVGDRLRTSLVVSVSGGGKDYLLSNALRKFLEVYPQFRAIVMDCKDDPKEYGYFGDLARVKVYRLNLATSSDSTISAWIDAVLDDFNSRPEKTLLICNEGTLVRDKSKRYVDAIASLVSSGDSRQKYAWEAGQSGHTDDLKINGAARSRFRPMVISMSDEEMQIEAILRAKWLADSANDMQACRSEMRRSPVGRAWSDGQRWYAMPKLENYAGYDRDSRSFTQQSQAESQTENQPEIEANQQVETIQNTEEKEDKSNIQKPNLSRSDLMLQIGILGEWLDKNPGLSFSQQYANYSAARKGFSRPEFRYLLTQVENLDS